jgi:ATP-dependent nuclease subunit A
MWTEAQQAAIDIKKGSILVSAAAGSGKTAVLVERIIKKITDSKNPIDVDSLLVMTFTRAAAASMKEKIYNALLKEMEKYENNTKEFKRLKEQSILLSSAKIMTTDSFCLSIIKENIDKIDIDPAFNVADESEISLLRADTMEELLESEYEAANEDFMDLTDAFANTKGDRSISEFVERLYRFAISKPWPIEWLDSLVEGESKWQDYIYSEIIKSIDSILADIEEIIGICNEEEGPANYLDTVLEEQSAIGKIKKSADIFELSKNLNNISFGRLKAVRNVDEELKNKAKALRDNYKETISKLAQEYLFDKERLLEEESKEKSKVRAIVDLTKKYIALFNEKKREKNLVDFSDIEHLALGILLDEEKKPTEVALSYKREFSEIYIDEYQDSNYLQEAIVMAIEKNNIFMVGDVKQSIYGFRQASPELFMDKYKRFSHFENTNLEGEDAKMVILSKNFRSRNNVLKSANIIFKKVMKEDTGGIEYDDDAALYPGAAFEEGNEYISEIMLTETGGIEDDTSSIELEARAIAQRIKELKSELRVDGGRKLRYSDIVILVRTNIGEGIAKVLNDENIPAYAENNKGYFKTFEVRKILAVLAAIDNPYSDVDLCAFLNSSLVGMTDLEMANIVSNYRKAQNIEKSEKIRMMDAILYENESGDISEETRKKIQNAIKFLNKYRKKSAYMNIAALLQDIYNETDFLNLISAMPGGQVRRANLMLLINKAGTFSNSGYSGLYNFIRYISKLKDFDNDFGEASILSENDDIVRIMTIHKSKGLEFPVCFLACANKLFNKMDLKQGMVIDSEFGLGVQYVDSKKNIKDSSIKQNVIKHKLNADLMGEELRVLYVALTRAMEKMIISGSCKDVDKALEKNKDNPNFLDIRSCNSYLDMILLSFDNVHFDIRKYDYTMLLKEEKETQKEVGDLHKVFESIDIKEHNILKNRLDYVYPYLENIDLKTKFSVSEIKKLSQSEEFEIKDVKRAKSNSSDASERGNAYHKLLQKIHYENIGKFSDIKDFIREEISLLKNKKYRELIDIDDIVKFLNTNLGGEFVKQYQNLKRENQFIMGLSAKEAGMGSSDETILIQGVIDAYIENENGIILVDYKTDNVNNEDVLINRYRSQLMLYKKSLEMSTGKTVQAVYIYSFALGKEISLK